MMVTITIQAILQQLVPKSPECINQASWIFLVLQSLGIYPVCGMDTTQGKLVALSDLSRVLQCTHVLGVWLQPFDVPAQIDNRLVALLHPYLKLIPSTLTVHYSHV